jgi:hypothetical protein
MNKKHKAARATKYATYNRMAHTETHEVPHVHSKLSIQHEHQDNNKLYPLVHPRTRLNPPTTSATLSTPNIST